MRVRREVGATTCLMRGFHGRSWLANFSSWVRWMAAMLALSSCFLLAADP